MMMMVKNQDKHEWNWCFIIMVLEQLLCLFCHPCRLLHFSMKSNITNIPQRTWSLRFLDESTFCAAPEIKMFFFCCWSFMLRTFVASKKNHVGGWWKIVTSQGYSPSFDARRIRWKFFRTEALTLAYDQPYKSWRYSLYAFRASTLISSF